MNKIAKFVVGLAAVGSMAMAAASAQAATIQYLPGPNYAEKVHGDHQASNKNVTLKTDTSKYLVDFSADEKLNPNGNGFASLDGDFSWLTIDPQTVGMSKLGFTLKADGKNDDFKFNILVNFVGGGSQVLDGLLKNNGKVDIWAQGNEVIESIKIYNLTGKDGRHRKSYDFDDIKHISFNAVQPTVSAVPEPATWAMMILGFGLAGTAVRTARRQQTNMVTA